MKIKCKHRWNHVRAQLTNISLDDPASGFALGCLVLEKKSGEGVAAIAIATMSLLT